MLITEDIRNKTIFDFLLPLPLEQIKDYQELFALAVLRYVYPEIYNDYIKADAPDLQSTDKKSGVEVTSAIRQNDAIINGNSVKYRLTKNRTKRERLKEKIKQVGGDIDEYSVSYPPKDSTIELKVIYDSILRKNKKLDQYKAKGFQKMSLFIFYEEPICPLREEQAQGLLESVRNQNTFDTIYFCMPFLLISYQCMNNTVQITNIPQNDFEALSTIVRMTVDGEIKLNSTIWTMSNKCN